MFAERRGRIDGGWLAWYYPDDNLLVIDPDLPERAVRRIREQTIHRVLGNDHLAPDTATRPRLEVITGGGEPGNGRQSPLTWSAS